MGAAARQSTPRGCGCPNLESSRRPVRRHRPRGERRRGGHAGRPRAGSWPARTPGSRSPTAAFGCAAGIHRLPAHDLPRRPRPARANAIGRLDGHDEACLVQHWGLWALLRTVLDRREAEARAPPPRHGAGRQPGRRPELAAAQDGSPTRDEEPPVESLGDGGGAVVDAEFGVDVEQVGSGRDRAGEDHRTARPPPPLGTVPQRTGLIDGSTDRGASRTLHGALRSILLTATRPS